MHRAMGHACLPDSSRADALLVLIERVTCVVPDPAATELGVNVAVAPLGSPLAEKLIAAGNVDPPDGVKVNV